MKSLAGKTLFITGASRGIGLAIAKRASRDGAKIAIVAKTSEPNPKLEVGCAQATGPNRTEHGRQTELIADHSKSLQAL